MSSTSLPQVINSVASNPRGVSFESRRSCVKIREVFKIKGLHLRLNLSIHPFQEMSSTVQNKSCCEKRKDSPLLRLEVNNLHFWIPWLITSSQVSLCPHLQKKMNSFTKKGFFLILFTAEYLTAIVEAFARAGIDTFVKYTLVIVLQKKKGWR